MKYFFLFVCLTVFVSVAIGSENHHTRPYNPTETPVQPVTQETTIIERVEGTALGIAHSQLQFDKNISGLQVGIGGGFYDNQEAVAFGLAKQIKEKMIKSETQSDKN